MSHTGTERALIAALAVAALIAGHGGLVVLAAAVAGAVYACRRLRRWRPTPGMRVCAGLALAAAWVAA
jgi:hypothetical protein